MISPIHRIYHYPPIHPIKPITVYINDRIQDFDLQEALGIVSKERRDYALRYRREHDQRLCLATYMLLQQALKEKHGINEPPQFISGPHGKPSLKNHPEIHFNLSHCDEAAVCVIGTRPVGIDVESIHPFDSELAADTMNPEELRIIHSSTDPSIAFTRFWTMKESLLKLTGEGITDNLPGILSTAERYHFVTEEHEKERYVLTWVAEKTQNL